MPLIATPYELDRQMQTVNDLFYRIDPHDRIPWDILNRMTDVLNEWSEAWMTADWGYSSTKVESSATWSASEKSKYNAMLAEAQQLVKQAAASPGVKVLIESPVAPPKPGPVQPMPDTLITAKVPWGWIIGSAAVMVGVVAILSKKERLPSPVLAEPGYYSRRHRKHW